MIKYVFRVKRKKAGKKVVERLYSGRYRLDGEAKIFTVALKTSDKQVAEQKLNAIVREAEREAAGLIPPKLEIISAQRPLADHLGDFLANLATEETSEKYRYNLKMRLQKLFTECSWGFPKDITSDSFLKWRARQTCAPKTKNEYRDAAIRLLNWLMLTKRVTNNPLADVPKVDGRGKEQRKRRAYSSDQLGRLLEVAGESRIGYLAAAHTGLRRKELKSLVWDDLHLDIESPYVHVRASTTKNKKTVALPLHPELVAELRAYKPSTAQSSDPVFPGKTIAGMWKLKSDLKKAGVPYLDDLGRQLDFHALRYTLATNLSKAGVAPRVAMLMLRHSEIGLTMKTYTDETFLPLKAAIEAQPAHITLSTSTANSNVETAPEKHTQIHTQTPDFSGHDLSPHGADDQKPFVSQLPENEEDWRNLARSDMKCHFERMAPAVGFEPTTNRLTADRSTTELRWSYRKGRVKCRGTALFASAFLHDFFAFCDDEVMHRVVGAIEEIGLVLEHGHHLGSLRSGDGGFLRFPDGFGDAVDRGIRHFIPWQRVGHDVVLEVFHDAGELGDHLGVIVFPIAVEFLGAESGFLAENDKDFEHDGVVFD